MTHRDSLDVVIRYWREKAQASLASARSELVTGRYDFAVNRAYYACFYSASAVLLNRGRKFVKHSGLRVAVHRDLVKTGDLGIEWGRVFDRLFANRQRADYQELADFDLAQAEQLIDQAEGFARQMDRLLSP